MLVYVAGSFAINPATGERVPIWVADYVLGSYGSGAIMAVPAHDTRDHEFAQHYGLPIVRVVQGRGAEAEQHTPFTGEEVHHMLLSLLQEQMLYDPAQSGKSHSVI